MRLLIKAVTSLGAVFLAASNSQAGLMVDLEGAFAGSADYYAPGNNIVGSAPGYFGAQLYTQGETTLQFEFLGADSEWQTTFDVTNEAGASGRFVYNPSATYSPAGASHQEMHSPFTFTFADGVLDFDFEVNKYFTDRSGEERTFTNQAVNGSNYVLDGMHDWTDSRAATFWTGLEFDGDDLVSVTLALNGSHWGRDDYDNMVVRITEVASPVPLPASIPLFTMALVSLGLFRRKS